MRLKHILLTVIVIFVCLSGYAQDKIVKRNGEIIEAKVSEINQDNVVFKRYDNLEGPQYSIPKADVAMIKYPNGTEDIFEDYNDQIGVKRRDMGNPNGHGMHDEAGVLPNIISVAPLAFTENGEGVSISLEHALDSKGIVNFYLPLFLTFNRSNDPYTGAPATYPMLYAMPGIKVYTNLNTRNKIKFSIGPSLVIAAGNGNLNNENSNYYNGGGTNATENRFLLGGMANIGLNIFPSAHLYLGTELGLGFCYLNDYGSYNQGFSSLAQFTFKVGYRYGHKKIAAPKR